MIGNTSCNTYFSKSHLTIHIKSVLCIEFYFSFLCILNVFFFLINCTAIWSHVLFSLVSVLSAWVLVSFYGYSFVIIRFSCSCLVSSFTLCIYFLFGLVLCLVSSMFRGCVVIHLRLIIKDHLCSYSFIVWFLQQPSVTGITIITIENNIIIHKYYIEMTNIRIWK